MKKYINICHLTTAHTRNDVRIFHKECVSLAKVANFNVNLIVADGKKDEIKYNVKIQSVIKLNGRLNRFFKTTKNVYKKAIEINADIYHLHDPELIFVGLKLLNKGKKVVFDAHEDVPKQLLGKPYLNTVLLFFLSKTFSLFENYACKKYSYIITATPTIKEKFLKINKNTQDINNFPILKEFSKDIKWGEKKDEVCYIGGISKIRGINEIVTAFDDVSEIKLNLAGNFVEKNIENDVKEMKGWKQVNNFGYVDRDEINDILSISKAGLVTLYPIINYKESLPVKMFEYMAAGIPVIYSNFDLWKGIVEKENCGIAVDPLIPSEINNAIKYIILNPKEAELMGQNGKKAVFSKYNWNVEENKLINVYKELLS